MSTEIKNTLFRFVTMRAPELLSKDDKKNGFIFHPDLKNEKISEETNSFFKELLINPKQTNQEQINALYLKAKQFENENLVLDKIKLEELVNSTFYNYSNTLSKLKKNDFNKNNLIDIISKINPVNIELEFLITIWDNLFYQIITQKNNSLRDNLIHVLIANHTLNNINNAESLVKASLVIPPAFFGDLSDLSTLNKNNNLNLKTNKEVLDTLLKSSKTATAQNTINYAVALKNELEALEKIYRKEEEENRNRAFNSFKAAQELAYKNATFEIKSIENKVTGEIRTYKEYTELNLPKFEYEPIQEIDLEKLGNSLNNQLTALVDIEKLKNCKTYKEIQELLNKVIEEANNLISKINPLNQKIAFIAGTPIASKNSVLSRSSNVIPYSACLTYIDNYLIDLKNNSNLGKTVNGGETGIPVTNWINLNIVIANIVLADLVNISNSFTITKTDGTILFDGIELIADTNAFGTVVFSDIYNSEPYQIPKSITEIKVKGKITLVDTSFDLEVTINIGPILIDNSERTGSGYFNVPANSNNGNTADNGNTTDNSGTGNNNPENNPPVSNNTSNTPPTIFIPSRFGIKNLGIADYRKVEQEICCYEPGEVSHIENIMAREYKEKATERSRTTDTTTTTSSERESENLTDTTTTSRNEMHTEVAQVLHEDTQMNAQASYHWGTSNFVGGAISGNLAHNTSQDDSTNQAMTYAQDITQRAMERVVTKTKSEVITKVIESYKENNKHGFDNTKGDQHVSGVYRWVNKVYNNQLVNYGKRAMVEFMIPEPAQFHILASVKNTEEDTTVTIKKPVDPRSSDAGNNKIETFKDIAKSNNPNNYIFWTSLYGVEAEIAPSPFLSAGKSFTKSETGGDGGNDQNKAVAADIDVPEGYYLDHAYATWEQIDGEVFVKAANKSLSNNLSTNFLENFTTKIPVSVAFEWVWLANVNVNLTFKCSDELYQSWQNRIFNDIIDAYEKKLAEYNKAVQDAKDKAAEEISTNPMYYRQIERNMLKKSIVHYLVDSNYIGQDYIENDTDLTLIKPINNETFDKNAAVTRFIEQAFEWDIISYIFYPFYWGSKDRWKKAYNYQFGDALFTNFMQAGMARVILTVRPGFEKVVNWYMATGQVWDGGQVPTLGEELFLSIDQELKVTDPTPEGLPWKTKLPSDLTVIQSSTIGLEAEGLPCGCPKTVGGEVNLNNEIKSTNTLIGGPKTTTPEPTPIVSPTDTPTNQ